MKAGQILTVNKAAPDGSKRKMTLGDGVSKVTEFDLDEDSEEKESDTVAILKLELSEE